LDPVRQILEFNAGRDPERLLLKYRAMRASPFAFLRGSCHLFYARLPRRGVFKSAPLAWVCGDLHLQNFGSYKGDNRLVYFDINDFDEAALAPASWELVRVLTSLLVGAADLNLDHANAQALCQHFLDAYTSALKLGKAYWVERDTAQGPVRALLDGLHARQRASFLDTRTTLKRRSRQLRIDGRKALPATASQRAAVVDFMHAFASTQPQPGFFSVLDVARRIAGTGSLGVDRFAILVQGKGSPDGNYILDLKHTLPSSLAPNLNVPQPKWKSEAERVVAVQQRMQAVPMAFLHAVRFDAKPFTLRALQPAEDRLTLGGSRLAAEPLAQLVATLAHVVAWAQLRSAGREGSASADEWIAFGQRKKWQGLLLDASLDCAAQVTKDAVAYNAAWDGGAFRV
jgi:uncharacterized protein (DUF2252 family)